MWTKCCSVVYCKRRKRWRLWVGVTIVIFLLCALDGVAIHVFFAMPFGLIEILIWSSFFPIQSIIMPRSNCLCFKVPWPCLMIYPSLRECCKETDNQVLITYSGPLFRGLSVCLSCLFPTQKRNRDSGVILYEESASVLIQHVPWD